MAEGIGLPITILMPNPLLDSTEAAESETRLYSIPAEIGDGGENGAVFFNLDWQNRQAENLRQRLATIFGDAAPHQSQFSWNDLINLAKNHDDFKEFRHLPETLWRQARQMSAPRVVRDEFGNQTRAVSRFDELLARMQESKMSLREFAETLPPNERDAFRLRFQLEQTFGTRVPLNDAPVDETGQNYSQEYQLKGSFESPENQPPSTENARTMTRGENVFNGAPHPNTLAGNNLNLSNAAPTGSLPTAFGVLVSPHSAAHGFGNAALESKANGNPHNQLENGLPIGGALIGGSIAARENQNESENLKINDRQTSRGNFDGQGSLAAGAGGALLSAAIGKIAANGETTIGILGFVSGALVGAEADRGWRWLSAGAINLTKIAGGGNFANQKQLIGEESSPAGTYLQLAPA